MNIDVVVDGGRQVTARVEASEYPTLKREDIIGVGTATCNPGDHFVEKIGTQIAVGRALQDYGRQLAERWAARAVTEEEVRARRGEVLNTVEEAPMRATKDGWVKKTTEGWVPVTAEETPEEAPLEAVAVRDAILGQPAEEVVLVNEVELDAFVSMIAEQVARKLLGVES